MGKLRKVREKINFIKDLVNEKIAQIYLQIVSVILTIGLVRILNPSEYGLFVIFSSLTFIFNTFYNFGISHMLIKYIPSNYREIKKITIKYLALQFVIVSLFTFFLFILSPLFVRIILKGNFIVYFLSISLSIIASYNLTFRSIFIATFRFDKYRKM